MVGCCSSVDSVRRVTHDRDVPILWLYGADAVGKSTVAWEIYDHLASQGVPAAYVDTDYLGFCSPLPSDEPSELVAANLRSMWTNFAAAGARCLIVSGIVVTPEQRQTFEQAIEGGVLTRVAFGHARRRWRPGS